ncbi:transposase [Paeniglutamicibacter sp. Y32M11]|uniref:transposase n=1 Tax=Paeniglutamicibacter sp. Y32M11 TaxID=2853258 RepID=UPI001C52B386|nr:transposase [Paeniglutamicibacter sp. Y32M11]
MAGDGQRQVLGFDLSDCVNEALGIVFLRFSKTRGLGGVDLATSDAHMCLKRSIATAFQGAARQRFRRHFMRNVLTTCRAPKKVSSPLSAPPSACPRHNRSSSSTRKVIKLFASSHPKVWGCFGCPRGRAGFHPVPATSLACWWPGESGQWRPACSQSIRSEWS